MNFTAKKIWKVPSKKHTTMFHNQGTRKTEESIDRESKTFSQEQGEVTYSSSSNKNPHIKIDSKVPTKNTTESRASEVPKASKEKEFPAFSESSTAAMIPTTSTTTTDATTTVSVTSDSDAISRSHSRATMSKDVTMGECVTTDDIVTADKNESITKKDNQSRSLLSLGQLCTATRTATIVSTVTKGVSNKMSTMATAVKNRSTATLDLSSKVATFTATNRETSITSCKKSGNKTEIKDESRDDLEQEGIIKTEANKRTYALRRSTINSSLTVPWYKRFPPPTPKIPLFDKSPSPVPYPNLCTYPTIKSKELQEKDRVYSSKLHPPKKGKLQSELGNLKLKFGSDVPTSFESLKSEATKEKISRKIDTEKKVKLEEVSPQVKGKVVKTSTAASQRKHLKEEITHKKTKSKLPKHSAMGQQTSKKIVESPGSFTDSYRTSTTSFQIAACGQKQKKPAENLSLENWRSNDEKSSLPSIGCSRKRSAGKESDIKYPAEKIMNSDKKSISLKLKLDPPAKKSNVVDDTHQKFRQEKKVKLVTPYQILKGKEHMEKSTSIILKRKTMDDEKQVRYPYDSKRKLVTPLQILKGKEKVGETSGAFLKKSETHYSNLKCYTEESSSECLNLNNQEEVYHRESWKIVEGPSLGEIIEKRSSRKEIFEGPSSSGKYEADTTTSTSSCYLNKMNEEKERRRAKKKEKKAKKLKIRKKKKEKKRKRKEKNRGEDELVTSSHVETERAMFGNPFSESLTERHTQRERVETSEFVPIIEIDSNRQSQNTNSTKTKPLCNVRKL